MTLFESIDFYTSLTRARFEELCQDLFCSTLEPVEKILRDSTVDKANVHEIALVGCSNSYSHIVKLVSDFFNGKEPYEPINPDEADAYGAAVQVAIVKGDNSMSLLSRSVRILVRLIRVMHGPTSPSQVSRPSVVS